MMPCLVNSNSLHRKFTRGLGSEDSLDIERATHRMNRSNVEISGRLDMG